MDVHNMSEGQSEPNSAEKNRYICFEVLKIIQFSVCLFFVVIGLLWGLLYFIVSDWGWRFIIGSGQGRHITDGIDTVNLLLWWNVIVSPFGLVGAMGQAICPQVVYAILVAPFLFYSVIPWIIVIGICYEWDRPKYYYEVHK